MLRLTCLLLCSILLQINSLEDIVFTSEAHNSVTVEIGNYFYTIFTNSARDDSYIEIQSNAKNYVQCRIAMLHENRITSHIKASPMKNGKIVILGTQERIKQADSAAMKSTYSVMIINPYECSYKALRTMTDYTSRKFPISSASLIAYEDTFDIFLPSGASCSPCRYDNEGRTVPLNRRFPLEISAPSAAYHVHALLDENWKLHGYFFAYNYDDFTSLARILDSKFTVLKEEYYDHPISAVSTSFNTHPLIGVCFQRRHSIDILGEKKNEIVCQNLDLNLQPTFSSVLPDLITMSTKYDLKIDSHGYLYIVILLPSINYITPGKKTMKVHNYRLDNSTGAIISTGRHHYNFSGLHWNVDSFLMAGNKYCFTVSRDDLDELTGQSKRHVTIKCKRFL